MEKFRISNDLSIFWSITEKDGKPYNLSDKTVRLIVTYPRGRMDVTDDITIQDNVICWLFRGSKQRYLGTYKITVEIQATPADRTIRKDIPEAFELVSSTQYEQTEIGRPDINEEGELTLATSLDIFQIKPIIPQVGPNRNWWVDGADTGKSSVGLTAYEFAKEQGYEGTVEEYEQECLHVPYYNELSRIATAESEQATQQSIAQQKEVSIYMKDVAEPSIARAQQAAAKAEQAITSIPKKTSQLVNDSGFITKNDAPTPDWNASTYKEGHIKNRTHHMQDYMCHYFKGSPIKVSKPSGTGYVLLTYDTDLADKFIRIEIKADESKTYEFLDAMGMPIIFTWDNSSSTINVQTFGGALESYSMRAYYSSSAKGFDDYFIALDEGFIPKTIARKKDIADLQEENAQLRERIAEQDIMIEDLQNTKIEKENDDYYPKMAVGLADNLAGVDVVDSEINFRRSGGGAITDGVARIESIKGNSVVWNEIFKAYPGSVGTKVVNGVTYTLTAEGDITAEGTAEGTSAALVLSSMPLIGTHKYLILVPNMAVSSWGNVALYADGYNTDANQSQPSNGWSIFKATDTRVVSLMLTVWAGKPISLNTRVSYYDLTKMFGAGNEPTTIEEFYARIPMGVDLNAYNEGEVIHMDVQSIESQGVNAWDEEWETGSISATTGEPVDKAGIIRTKNMIPIMYGKTYYNSSLYKIYLRFYDEKKNFLSYWEAEAKTTINIPPSKARFFKFTFESSTYNHDVCINISDTSINGKYFPYIKRVEDLAVIRKYFPNGMKSAGTAHDEIRYNKTTQKWEKVVRIGEVDMGTLNWAYRNVEGSFNLYVSDSRFYESQGLLTANYINLGGNQEGRIYSASAALRVTDSAYTDAASFKAAMAGVMLYYELAEPIITELDEADQFKDLDYAVWNAGTEKAIAEGKSAPLAADITYGFNAIGKIKELESLVAQLRAKVGI